MNTSFERSKTTTSEWLTPPEIIKSLGEFDLDPCAPVNRPWNMAKNHFTIKDNGLQKDWSGRVWCNPPYGQVAKLFLKKLAKHGNGIALIFARTETKTWFNYIWDEAHAILFIKNRIYFYKNDGTKGGSAGSPSALIAYGLKNVIALKKCKIEGKLIDLTMQQPSYFIKENKENLFNKQ